MATPSGSSGQDREELEKRLQHMKKKYAHIQKKLQKSVKQKKVKEHVKRKLAELQHTEGDASPANTSRDDFKDINNEAQFSSGSFLRGPLQLDDSISENTNQEQSVKLNRKCASSGRLKKRRSVSFVLNKDDDASKKTLDEEDCGDLDSIPARKETLTTQSSKDASSPEEIKTAAVNCCHHEESRVLTRDGQRSDTSILQDDSSDASVISESKNVAENISDDIMCVEETQDLSQLVAPKRLFQQTKKFDAVCSTSKEQVHPTRKLNKYKDQSLEKSTNEKDRDNSGSGRYPTGPQSTKEGTKLNANKTILSEHNALNSANNAPNYSDLSSPHTEICNLDSFSDPGPRTTRSGRRRARRSREITASDISMKDVIQNSQSSQNGNHTWIEGLIYPVEYYVRKTRSMNGKSSPAIYSENLLANVIDGTDYVDKAVKGRTSGRGKRKRQTNVAPQHDNTSSQRGVGISSEDSSVKILVNLNVTDDTVTDVFNVKSLKELAHDESEADEPKKDEHVDEGGDGMKQTGSDLHISTQNSVELLYLSDFKESVEETQQEMETKASSFSTQLSNSSAGSGRRNLSLSRRKKGLRNKTDRNLVSDADVKENQLNTDKLDQPSQQDDLDQLSTEWNKTDETDRLSQRSVLPKISCDVKTKILSQMVEFTLPDDEFVEMKLSKTKSSTLPVSKASQCSDEIESSVRREDVHESTHTADEDTPSTSPCSLDIRLSSKQEECEFHSAKLIDFPTPSSAIDLPLAKSYQENVKVPSRDSCKSSKSNKPIKPSSQHSQGVLESQFSQTQQHIPGGTPVFPHMGCSPGSSPTSIVVSQPTLVTSPSSQDAPQVVAGPRMMLSPTSDSELGTMSFSPQQCSPTSRFHYKDGTSPEICTISDRVDGRKQVDVNNKDVDTLTSHGTSEKEAVQENLQESYKEASPSPDEEHSSPDCVVTPPMTSGNIAHTSPFADVATATPYGKAEMPRCQSQCDPEDEEEEMVGGVDVEEMTGFQFAGCLKHDFKDYPSPVIGMHSCNIILDDTDVACLVLYSVDLVVLWKARNQQEWQIQAAWTVSEEEIACVKLAACREENTILIVIGGSFRQCSARVMRYNMSTCDQHQLDLAHTLNSGGIEYQDVCVVSHNTFLIHGRENHGRHVIYKLSTSEDFSEVTCSMMHQVENGVISMQRVQGVEGMVVMVIGQDLYLWDCDSEHVLQMFSVPVASDVCSTCIWAATEAGVLFTVLGLKSTDETRPDKLLSPCVLLALNPATGKSAIIHQYKIPGTTEGSNSWFVDGSVVQNNLAVKTSDGRLVIWDVHSAHAMTKTLNSARFCWTLTQQGSLVVSQEGSACIHQYQYVQ